MRSLIILVVVWMFSHSIGFSQSTNAKENQFYENFCDSTLRIDYIFSGNYSSQSIALDKLNFFRHWYGKRHNMSDIPVEGNGQINVYRHNTKELLYKNSFSTLFQEWLSYDEAKNTSKAFENVCLIPYPRDTVDVSIELKDNRHNVIASMQHSIVPNDILIRHIGISTPYVAIQKARDSQKCINIAFVAEGYTKDEMSIFLTDVKTATEALFEHEPFVSMRDRFNIVAVESESQESGTSKPSEGIWKKTVLGSHFDTFYSSRYLTTLNIKKLHDVLAGIPYEHIIVLVNTNEYGGGGILNSYNLSMTHHPYFKQVVVHEFGHSFAGLADEYAYEQEQIPMYPTDVEPWEKNITTLVNFKDKWESLIKPGTPIPTPQSKKRLVQNVIGVYEGAGYSLNGVYRPTIDCRMRSNQTPEFCPACQKALRELIDFYTK